MVQDWTGVFPDFNYSPQSDIYFEMDTLVSMQCNLEDILVRSSFPDDIRIFLSRSLTMEAAKQLAHGLARLATKVDIPHLSLILYCECSSRVGAIVAEGLRPLQGLKNIALVFKSVPGPASKFAKTVGVSLQCTQKIGKAASFTTLPREIRHSIMDFVFNTGHIQEIYIDGNPPMKRFLCCEKCVPASVVKQGYCACYRLVGGYSTTCRCDCTRTALFWTNKLLCMDSMFVLLSTNRITLSGLQPMFEFFSTLPIVGLHAMKIIDIRIKHFEYRLYAEQIPDEFTKIVSIMKEKCNLNMLWLSIDLRNWSQDEWPQDEWSQDEWFHGRWLHGIWPRDEWREIDQIRENLTSALKPLQGLDRLDVYLGGGKAEDEDKMEKSIMGKDYDAIARGKIHKFFRDPMNVRSMRVILDGGLDDW